MIDGKPYKKDITLFIIRITFFLLIIFILYISSRLLLLIKISPDSLRYAYSALAQVVAAVFAITLTVRVILSQNLKYRFPLEAVSSLGLLEVTYFLSGASIIFLSILFLILENQFFFFPVFFFATFWLFVLLPYYREIQKKLSLENLLDKARELDKKRICKDKQNYIKINVSSLHLYDLAIQAIEKKDFLFLREILFHTAYISKTYPAFIINEQFLEINRQFFENKAVFEICLQIIYRFFSPIRIGTFPGVFSLFDSKDIYTPLSDTKNYVNEVYFSKSVFYSNSNLTQAIYELNKFKDEYLSYQLNKQENKVIKTKITTIIMSAIADLLCLDQKSDTDLINLGFNKDDIEFRMDSISKLIVFLKNIEEEILLKASSDVAHKLIIHPFIHGSESNEEERKKASDYLFKVKRFAADLLEQMLNKRLHDSRKELKYLHFITSDEGFQWKLDWIEQPNGIRHTYVGCSQYGTTEHGYWINKTDRLTDFESCSSCREKYNKDFQEKPGKKVGST